MRDVSTAILEFENNIFADFSSPEYLDLQSKLDYLLKKGTFEARNLTSFKKKLSSLT